MIVGIDQSLSCTGVVVLSPKGDLIYHETITSDKSLETFERATEIAKRIAVIGMYHSASKYVLEGLSFGSMTNATRDLAKLQGIIEKELNDYAKHRCEVVAPTSLKKFATGNGRAKKEEMFEALPADIQGVFGKYPKTKGRFDLTDAYFLAKKAV